MIALALAIAVVRRPPMAEVALAIGAIHRPAVTGTVVLIMAAITAYRDARSRPVDPTVGRIVSAAGDLRAGKPLRSVAASGLFGDLVASLADSGRPIRARPEDLEPAFGADAVLVQATLELATEGGGPVADAFDRLAADMIETERTRRERRAALAPVVAQASIIGGVPVVVLVHMVITGRWFALVARGAMSATVVLAGTAALVVGAVWVALLAGRRHRG